MLSLSQTKTVGDDNLGKNYITLIRKLKGIELKLSIFFLYVLRRPVYLWVDKWRLGDSWVLMPVGDGRVRCVTFSAYYHKLGADIWMICYLSF